jgi:hypothetical protein
MKKERNKNKLLLEIDPRDIGDIAFANRRCNDFA